jgi:hypothetical protein
MLTGAAVGGYVAVRLGTYLQRRLTSDEQADLDAAARSLTGAPHSDPGPHGTKPHGAGNRKKDSSNAL